jgi:beta-lactamase regulating signal transducer with metallopeptidase domain
MVLEHFVLDALRVAFVLGLALLAMIPLRRRAPAARRVVLAVALSGAFVMPLATWMIPAMPLPAPVATMALRAREVTEGLVDRAVLTTTPSAAPVAAPVASPASPHPAIDRRTWVLGVWAAGGLLVLLRLTVGVGRSRALLRRAGPARGWSAAAERARRVTGLRADVRMTDEVTAPAVTGIVRPVVLVPPASESWSDQRRYTVLLHELAHVRHHDCLFQIVAQLVCALNWFDPLAWVVARRLGLERELAADDAVLAAGERASRYAEELLAIASAAWGEGDVPPGALGMGERSSLTARISALVAAQGPRRPPSRGRRAALIASCSLVVVGAACARPPTATSAVGTSAALTLKDQAGPASESTVRPALQRIVEDEIDRVLADSHGESGAILMLDPWTGEILADAGRVGGKSADVAVGSAYFPGSTLKAVTLAGALDDGILLPDERIDCEQGVWTYAGRMLHDAHASGLLGLSEMVAVSSNIGMAKVFDRMGGERLGWWLRTFRFGVSPPVYGANAGALPDHLEGRTYDGAITAIGELATASPLQIAAAYAALGNGGEYVSPTRTRRPGAPPRVRVIKPETATEVVSLLEAVVYGDRATGKLAEVPGVRVAGKTGTAEWDLPGGGEGVYASFVGLVPSRSPRFVIVVGVAQPQGETAGGAVAAPVFARVASRALASL